MSIKEQYYVYMHIRLDTGKPFYIGKGKGFRWKDKRSRNRFWNFITKKTPYKSKKILEGLTEEQAFSLERKLIKLYKAHNLCVANLALGGQGPSGYPSPLKGKSLSKETKKKISESRKGITAWNKGRKGIFSPESLKKLSEAHRGKSLSIDHKKAISENAKTTPLKVYIALCKQFRKPNQPSIYEKGKMVYTYNSLKEASEHLGIPYQHIVRVLNGSRKQCKGFIFERA